jgi:hypothetical protein
MGAQKGLTNDRLKPWTFGYVFRFIDKQKKSSKVQFCVLPLVTTSPSIAAAALGALSVSFKASGADDDDDILFSLNLIAPNYQIVVVNRLTSHSHSTPYLLLLFCCC